MNALRWVFVFAVAQILLLVVCIKARGESLKPLFDAIRQVESGGRCDLVGDGGRSVGPYQIQRSYWRDSGVPGNYQDVRDRAYAERVMVGYWKRYCPGALLTHDLRVLARVHNGGPLGHRKPSTLRYWEHVRREIR